MVQGTYVRPRLMNQFDPEQVAPGPMRADFQQPAGDSTDIAEMLMQRFGQMPRQEPFQYDTHASVGQFFDPTDSSMRDEAEMRRQIERPEDSAAPFKGNAESGPTDEDIAYMSENPTDSVLEDFEERFGFPPNVNWRNRQDMERDRRKAPKR